MKIFLAQQNYHIGNFEYNTKKIIEAIEEAKAQGGDLIVFSEQSVCGYPARDFLEFADFIKKCYQSIDAIKEHADTIGVLVGSPARNPKVEGKDLFNAAFFLHQKQIKAEVHKTLLPTYDVFDEYRYFEPAAQWDIIEYMGKKLAVTVCEDIWNIDDNPLYLTCPMDELMKQQPDIMINLSASPFDYLHEESRRDVIRKNVMQYKLPLIYCNAVGSQTEIVFDGASVTYNKKGEVCKALPSFAEALDFVIFDNDDIVAEESEQETRHKIQDSSIKIQETRKKTQETRDKQEETEHKTQEYMSQNEPANITTLQASRNIRQVHQALVMGIKDYFIKMNFREAIIGSSGGIDSAVTLALACEALGKENVRAVLMPSPYSTGHSVDDAVKLSENLQNPYNIIRINDVYETFLQTLHPIFGDLPFSVAEENLQSRTRGNILMAIANKFNLILLNTSNKSELSTGYGTLYGDMAGGLGVLGDCYKTQVYELVKYINRDGEIIPANIIHKAPSAELRPDQKDSDSLPDYDVLDKILFQYIERRQGPAEIKAQDFDAHLVDRTLSLVNRNEYKRNQFCPIIRISPKAFGVGRRMPIVGKYLS
ncbi:MAG: NAD+ synthase [Bacteroidota bacterium]|nr:NAD+ synthase [Bacteroidota bacterium]